MERLWGLRRDSYAKEKGLLKNVPDGGGNAESVLIAIYKHSSAKLNKHLDEKRGIILDAQVRTISPFVGLEIGTYCGYSAIRIASKLAKPDSRLISLEKDTVYHGVALEMVKRAGISSKVELFPGKLNERLDKLNHFLNEMKFPSFNFIFINDSNDYSSDLDLLKKRGLIRKGTVIVANIEGVAKERGLYMEYLEKVDGKFEINSEEMMIVATYRGSP